MLRAPSIVAFLAAALLAAALAGCGSSSDGTGAEDGGASSSSAPPGVAVKDCGSGRKGVAEIRVAGTSGCVAGHRIATVWSNSKNCAVPEKASRGSCRLGPLTCLSTVADRGVSVSCAMRGSTVSFLVRR